jgi:dTDP-4-dehydrorhamnose reductase
MRLLITGAAGMLGLDVQAEAAAAGHETVSLPRAELDITDFEAVAEAVARARVDAVINCAAYTDVDGAQDEAGAAVAHAVNGAGAGHVAAAAAQSGAWVVHVSSDYVFDGAKRTPYAESDPTNPASIYGASKLAGERAVAASAPVSHTTVRSSWLFGAGGACFPAAMLRLAGERDSLAVVDDQVGCPTFTGHLASALVDLAATPQPPLGVVHVAAEGECSWYEFAIEIFARTGSAVSVSPIDTASFGRPAPRPAYSVMRTERGDRIPRLPDWRVGLDAYLESRVTVG